MIGHVGSVAQQYARQLEVGRYGEREAMSTGAERRRGGEEVKPQRQEKLAEHMKGRSRTTRCISSSHAIHCSYILTDQVVIRNAIRRLLHYNNYDFSDHAVETNEVRQKRSEQSEGTTRHVV